MNLTYWLRKSPQPVTVLADDKRIDVPRNGRAWRDLTATIKALEPAKLTCLDKNNNVIRSVNLESESGGGEDEKSAASPEMSDLQLFAKLLAEGYEHGRKANQPIIDSAMQFVERQGARLMRAESEIERLRAHIHKQTQQMAELTSQPAPSEDDSSVLGSVVAGILQAQGQIPGQAPAKVSQINKGDQKK